MVTQPGPQSGCLQNPVFVRSSYREFLEFFGNAKASMSVPLVTSVQVVSGHEQLQQQLRVVSPG